MNIVQKLQWILALFAVWFACPSSALEVAPLAPTTLVMVVPPTQTLRAPTSIVVSVQAASATTSTSRAAVDGDFVKTQVLADFACPSGYHIERLRMQTPHDWQEVDVSSTSARTLANRTMAWSPIASVQDLEKACVEGKTYVDVSPKLQSVCASTSETNFDSAIQTPSQDVNIRILLSCGNVSAPRHVPARATAKTFLQDCTGMGGGVDGSSSPTLVTTTYRPRQCGSTYNPYNPKMSLTKVFESRHYCEQGNVLKGFARYMLTFDRSGAPASASYGQVRWCHAYMDADPYVNGETTIQRGKIAVNLLGSTPAYTVTGDSKLQFQAIKPPAPAGKPVCKRADFRILDEADLMVLTSGGDSSCSSSTRVGTVPLGFGGIKESARMGCINEANRLKRENQWNSLPSVGGGKRFAKVHSGIIGLVGQYCFGATTPSGSNWSYTVDCGDFTYQNEWNAIRSVQYDLECTSR